MIEAHAPESSDSNALALGSPKHNWMRLGTVSLLSLVLVGSLALWGYYLLTRQPVTRLLTPAMSVSAAFQPRYLFSIYGAQEPVGVAVTPGGDRIYVAESGGQRMVRVFDRNGGQLSSFAPPGSQIPARAPAYIAVQSTGMVYVVDRARRGVDTYDAGGNYKGTLKPAFPEGWSPLGIRFAGDDLILTEVTEKQHRILKLDQGGALTLQYGRQGQGEGDELWFPNSAVADTSGRIFISDSNNARIQVVDGEGHLVGSIRGFSIPRGMALDAEKRLHVVDAVDHKVKVFDVANQQAKRLFDFGDMGVGSGQFNYPNDIAIDTTGRVYVADRANNRVQVWVY
ncbi:MAG: hypothetical protein EPO21_23940 [Chloroflexota bacterium]|nr:MAG: hypothetical protein EPO21_23940 [Chloroflexota bacterium]